MISVIIPTWNRATIVARAVLSALSQTYQDIEVIVVDDGSTDNTRQILEPFGRKVRYLPLEHSGLPAVPRNAALHMARGEYVAFLDSDDEWLPEKLEQQIAVLEENSEVGLVCSNALVAKGNVFPHHLYHNVDYATTQWTLAELLRTNVVITSTVVLRHKIMVSTGVFSEDPMLQAIEDYDLWLRVAAVAKVVYIPEPLAVYRDDPAHSIRNVRNLSASWQGHLIILDRLRRFLDAQGIVDLLKQLSLEELYQTYREATCDALWEEGQWAEAAWCIWQMFRWQPMQTTWWVGCKLKGRTASLLHCWLGLRSSHKAVQPMLLSDKLPSGRPRTTNL